MKRKKINLPLILCAVFVAVLSCFACFRLSDTNVVKAESVDTNYTFHANDNYYIGVYDFSGRATGSRFILFNGNIDYNVTNGLSTRVISYISLYVGLGIDYDILDSISLYDNNLVSYGTGTSLTSFNISYDKPMRFTILNDNFTFFTYVYAQEGFNANVYKAELKLSTTNQWETSPRADGLKFFNIIYYDVNDRIFQFSFVVSADYWFNERTYFFNSLDTLTDNQIYNQGFQDGIQDNQPNIYSDGYNAGRVAGYNTGYNAGIESTNTYTFKNLIGAALDVPLNTFTSLFNFDILGVNLKDFLFAMFTICVVITIINLTRR